MTDAATLNRTVEVGPLSIANDRPFVLIAGPCALESRAHALETSHALVELTRKLGIGLIYKSSFDKANRTSLGSNRGIGLETSLPILAELRATFDVPVLASLEATFFMSQGARNWPFLTLIALPVSAAASSRSVWRDRKAGIWSTSTASATGPHCSGR